MRTGQLYIDGQDAYQQYGIFIVEGGYEDLVAMPPLKKPQTNDWHEEDGIEADLEEPALDSREVAIQFEAAGYFNRYVAFIELLSDRAYHTFEFAEIQRTYRLRMVSVPNQNDLWNLGSFTIRFADDFPLDGYEYAAPQTSQKIRDLLYIDDRDVSEYGITILQGTRQELTKTPDIKRNQEKTSRFCNGKEYDPEEVHYKSRNTRLRCLMRAETLAGLWQNYDALLYNLTRPKERVLYSKALGHTFNFFYRACKVRQFFPTGQIWLEFDLEITLMDNLRLWTPDEFILVSELYDIVCTEGLNGYAIDLSPERAPAVKQIAEEPASTGTPK